MEQFQQFENENEHQIAADQRVAQEIQNEMVGNQGPDLELNRIQSDIESIRNNTVHYGQIRNNVYAQIVARAVMGLFYNLLKLALTYYLYYIIQEQQVSKEASLNEKEWLLDLLTLFLASQLFNLVYTFFSTLCSRMQCCIRTQGCLGIAVLFNMVMIMLITYKLGQGYVINSHLDEPEYESKSIHVARLVTLFFGIFYFGFILCLICAIVVMVMDAKHQRQQRTNLLNNIKSVPYGGLIFKEGVECAICWDSFKEKDQVFKLKCHEMHIFHQQCLEDWMRKGTKTVCPLCRKPIQA